MSVTGPAGFRASGIAAGIKDNGRPDLSLIAALSGPVSAAASFTTNKAAAAPVQLSRRHLKESSGKIAAVIANSGCANCATGLAGSKAALITAQSVAGALGVAPGEVLVCSTGLIGIPLDIESLLGGIGPLVTSLGSAPSDARRAAEAIMTTDTHPKEVLIRGKGFFVGGMAKGAGMIAPNMATMLAMLTTDAEVSPTELADAFSIAVGCSFNELTVDGCTSTNDSAIVLASGAAGPVGHDELVSALSAACSDLAEQLAADAEGTTRVCRIHVRHAVSKAEARLAGRRVAQSLLVKTSLFGADPYWGRVLSELGASGASFELEKVTISYGEHVVFRAGEQVPHDRAGLVSYLEQPLVEITCDLGLGEESASILTTDLGHGYIDENMRTS